MANIQSSTTQGIAFQVNSKGQKRVEVFQSLNIGSERKHDIKDRNHHSGIDFDRPNDKHCPSHGVSRHGCDTVNLFPRRPHFPGLDTPFGRRECYDQARNCRDAYRYLELARVESEQQLMPDIKAGDLLRQAYHAGLDCKDAFQLFEVAALENEKQLMPDIKAGDVMRQAYHTALDSHDAEALIEIAQYEGKHNLMEDIKAGDILRQAQNMNLRRPHF